MGRYRTARRDFHYALNVPLGTSPHTIGYPWLGSLIAAMSFAVGCGMHRLSFAPAPSSVGSGPTTRTHANSQPQLLFDAAILPPPADEAEMIKRINVFSSVFQVSIRAPFSLLGYRC